MDDFDFELYLRNQRQFPPEYDYIVAEDQFDEREGRIRAAPVI
jgi:hypothetical protein